MSELLFFHATGQILSLQNPQDTAVKKVARKAMTILRGITADLPDNADLISICNQLPDLMGKVF